MWRKRFDLYGNLLKNLVIVFHSDNGRRWIIPFESEGIWLDVMIFGEFVKIGRENSHAQF